jgi:hypothetical protein
MVYWVRNGGKRVGCVQRLPEIPAPGDSNPVMAWLASSRIARDARLRHDGGDPLSRQRRYAPKKTEDADHQDLIRWSIQEVRRIANKLAQRRIQPAYIIAWSCWRRAHQAAARRAHIKSKMQL